jgi:hypothetical protein
MLKNQPDDKMDVQEPQMSQDTDRDWFKAELQKTLEEFDARMRDNAWMIRESISEYLEPLEKILLWSRRIAYVNFAAAVVLLVLWILTATAPTNREVGYRASEVPNPVASLPSLGVVASEAA